MLSSPDVSSALDRINLSDTKFTILAAAIAKADGQDLDEGALSRSTVKRKRSAHRFDIDRNVREEFLSTEKPPLVVHWDGKLLKDRTNKEDPKSNVERLPVVVSGYHVEKVLGVSKMSSGKGEAQAKATLQLLVLWEVVNDIIGMSFDTTASNTRAAKGACILLEREIGRNLLYLACRHHIHELVVGNVFTVLFGPSKGPAIPLFQQAWSSMNLQNFKPIDESNLISPYLQELAEEVKTFLRDILSKNEDYMPRDDYREIVELSLLVLGVLPYQKVYHFKSPGAYHLARWMAKVIYCLKIYLLREEFKLTARENKNLSDFCLFACVIYVKAWITSPITSDAPVNDLLLYKNVKKYSAVNKPVAELQ